MSSLPLYIEYERLLNSKPDKKIEPPVQNRVKTVTTKVEEKTTKQEKKQSKRIDSLEKIPKERAIFDPWIVDHQLYGSLTNFKLDFYESETVDM